MIWHPQSIPAGYRKTRGTEKRRKLMCSVERKKYIAMHIVGNKYLTKRDIFKT